MKPVAAVAFLALAAIALVGCEDARRSGQFEQGPSQGQTAIEEIPVDAVNSPKTYVTCQATFSAYESEYHWFDDSGAGHDDGTAPLSTFVLVEPAKYADRTVGILFKYAPDATTPSPPEGADVGCQFTFEVPEDFLSGEYKTIDNTTVRHFRRIEP